MGIIWWGTGGGGGGGGDKIPDVPPTLFGIEKKHIFQYLFAFYGHFYWTYPDHMFSLSTCIQIF